MNDFALKNNRTRRQKKTRLRHWLLLLAVVFQISVPLAQGLSAPVVAGNGIPVSMICGFTGGVTQIPPGVFNAYAMPNAIQDQDGKKASCPFCQSCSFNRSFSLDYVKVELSIRPVSVSEKWVYVDFAGSVFQAAVTGSHSRPRAPPSFA